MGFVQHDADLPWSERAEHHRVQTGGFLGSEQEAYYEATLTIIVFEYTIQEPGA